MKICKEVNFNKYSDLRDFSYSALAINTNTDTECPFCWLSILEGSEEVLDQYIPLVLEAAFHYNAACEKLMVSVTSVESNYKTWLSIAESIPGAMIIPIKRGKKRIYCILFPRIPNLDVI